ncbi:MAG: ABC transporter ATP-binding protein [Patescibacteria group bacterium]|jgi:putative ABC transport system ATP-binding protein
MLTVKQLTKKYYLNTPREFFALNNVTFSIRPGELVAILGKSGSGKSTLLNAIGGLETPDSGDIIYQGQSIYQGKNNHLITRFRAQHIGFVFQAYNLIPNLTALENVQLALDIVNIPKTNSEQQAVEILKFLGLEKYTYHKAIELSGGQQQRVALARALVKNPDLILADEATGNLDTENSQAIIDLLKKINQERNATILLVTHDLDIAKQCQRTIKIQDGKIIADYKNDTK